MNQHDQMLREVLRLALAALKKVRHVDQQHSEAERAIEQALDTEPAPFVRLTDEQIVHVLGDEIDNVYLQDFHKVMDAMIKKNGG